MNKTARPVLPLTTVMTLAKFKNSSMSQVTGAKLVHAAMGSDGAAIELTTSNGMSCLLATCF